MKKALQLGIDESAGGAQAVGEGRQADHRPRRRRPCCFNPRLIDFVSKRVGNYIWSAQFYMLLDQAWVQ